MSWQAIGLVISGLSYGSTAPASVPFALPACTSAEIQSASPAPALTDNAALAAPPDAGAAPVSAAYLIGLDGQNTPIVECYVGTAMTPMLAPTFEAAIASLKFKTPPAVNTAGPGGRYLVRAFSKNGQFVVAPPPDYPAVPNCSIVAPTSDQSDVPNLNPWRAPSPPPPRPVHRTPPKYPLRAEQEEIEGHVVVKLSVDGGGQTKVACLGAATPPGWFEKAAADAVSQWQFATAAPGTYIVTIQFKMQ